jgi:putative hydrolase of the HAD superfamily
MPAFRALLFDFNGTLTRSVRRGAHHLAVARILGCDPDTMIAVLDRSFYPRARGAYGSAAETMRWVAGQAGARPSREAVRHAVRERLRALRADTSLRPDAVPALCAARRRGLRTAVVSDCTHELPAILPALPVAPLLDAAVFSVEVGVCKPDRAIYLAACERLDVAPEECLYVGDGGSHELTGATEVGMTAVRLAAADLADHLVFGADVGFAGPQVPTLVEAVALLDRVPALAAA